MRRRLQQCVSSTCSNTRTLRRIISRSCVSGEGRPNEKHHYSRSSNVSFYMAQLAASDPCEDRDAHLPLSNGGHLHCVLDGHAGVHAAEYASEELLPQTQKMLERNGLLSGEGGDVIHGSDANEEQCAWLDAFTRAFQSTDDGFLEYVRLQPRASIVKTGTTACVAYITPDGSTAHIANAGDSRCVLARAGETAGQPPVPIVLSEDHNSNNRKEVQRITKEHPDDPQVFVSGYLKGRLQPTRGIGDLYLKHAEFNTPALGRTELKPPRCRVYDPPYVTATPTLVSHTFQERDLFIVMATDGLFTDVSNHEVVSVAASAMARGDDPARELAAFAVSEAAANQGYPLEAVLRIPPGKIRRRLHDDITVVVLAREASLST